MDITINPGDPLFWGAVIQIMWIDILLSGDNAIVIALACRSLPPRQRRLGIGFGVAAAVLARVVFAGLIVALLAVPFLKVVGAALLIYIAITLVIGEEADDGGAAVARSLWHAVALVVVADVTMSLDNVVAIAAASRGHVALFIFGLALSMPLMIVGASLISKMMTRMPWLVTLGGALLGWIAGEMIASDPFVLGKILDAAVDPRTITLVSAFLGTVLVVATGHIGRAYRLSR